MIQFSNAGKTYTSLIARRKVTALVGVDLEFNRGEVVGIAGPNGAGKSTLISLIMGFLQPSEGQVSIEGRAPRAWIQSHGVGYLTELVNLPPRWKVPVTLRRLAVLSGVPHAEVNDRVSQVTTQLGLDEHANKQIRQLSKGNLQRVGLAQALLGRFDVVVLDEPTHGLDPLWTQRFRDVVAELRSPDRLVIIASHNLDELERLADRVAILNKGRLQRVVESGSSSTAAATMVWRLAFESDVDMTIHFPAAVRHTGRTGSWRITATRAELSATLAGVLAGGAVLIECVPEESRLETAFKAAVQS
jgi:ABC-type multidrug transport system ATPase subunit